MERKANEGPVNQESERGAINQEVVKGKNWKWVDLVIDTQGKVCILKTSAPFIKVDKDRDREIGHLRVVLVNSLRILRRLTWRYIRWTRRRI